MPSSRHVRTLARPCSGEPGILTALQDVEVSPGRRGCICRPRVWACRGSGAGAGAQSGQPGGPQDWLFAGRLAQVMDGFAAGHDGLASVVIVSDVTGSSLGNTLCVDSRLGAAEAYLAQDVPEWALTNLQLDDAPGDRRVLVRRYLRVAVGVRRPDIYPSFLTFRAGRAHARGSRRDRRRSVWGDQGGVRSG